MPWGKKTGLKTGNQLEPVSVVWKEFLSGADHEVLVNEK